MNEKRKDPLRRQPKHVDGTVRALRDAAKVNMGRLWGADDIAAARLEKLTKLCLWLADFLEEQKVRRLSDLKPRR